jgi:hypothetical protein
MYSNISSSEADDYNGYELLRFQRLLYLVIVGAPF